MNHGNDHEAVLDSSLLSWEREVTAGSVPAPAFSIMALISEGPGFLREKAQGLISLANRYPDTHLVLGGDSRYQEGFALAQDLVASRPA